MDDNKHKNNEGEKLHNVKAEKGSASDPQQTELDGLKKGGVEPHVHPEDKENKRPTTDR